MIISKMKPYGIFSLILSGFLFIGISFFIYILFSVCFLGGDILKSTLSPFSAIIFILVFTLFLVGIFASWLLYAFNIRIDDENRTIYFQNIITRRTKLYGFNDFDGYFETYVNDKTGCYTVLYLVKNKKAEKIITGFYYKNMDELQKAISSIKYLGSQKNFSSIARKALFNRPVIE